MWNWFAVFYRNVRALGALAGILLAITVMSVVRCQEARDPVIVREREFATVISVAPGLIETEILATMVIATGDTLRVLVPKPLPTVGARVPLQVEVRDSGKRAYYVDRLAWMTGDF